MDISAEMILTLKSQVSLHVLIEITPGSKNRTIINVASLPVGKVLYTPDEVLDPVSYANLKPYFDGCRSVHFVVHNQKSILASLRASYEVLKYIRGLQVDVLQLEAITVRAMGLIPALLHLKKMILTIHDPIAHQGESDWRLRLINSAFFRFPVKKTFFFYSEFAKKQFEGAFPKYRSCPAYALRMQPYSYFKNYVQAPAAERGHILFIGRLSPYKGVDVLLDAMLSVFAEYPSEKLIIAGRSINGYEPDQRLVDAHGGRTIVLNRYIPNEELVELITTAKFVVCPYVEATQSGVVMTAFALHTPVLATDTGAFAEYIREGVNGGLVAAGDPSALSAGIIALLKDERHLDMIQQMKEGDLRDLDDVNSDVMKEVFGQIKRYEHVG